MGIPYVMNTAAAIMHCAATRQAMPKRPSNGNSSSRAARTKGDSMPLAVAATADYHIRGSAHPQEVLVTRLQGDAYREALCDTHPVKRFLDIRKTARQADHFRRDNPPANILYPSLDQGVGTFQQINCSASPLFDISQLGFTVEGGSMPAIGVDQGEERLVGCRVFAFR